MTSEYCRPIREEVTNVNTMNDITVLDFTRPGRVARQARHTVIIQRRAAMITTWSTATTTLCLLGFWPILRTAHCRSTSGHVVDAADYGIQPDPRARKCLHSCAVPVHSEDRMELNDALKVYKDIQFMIHFHIGLYLKPEPNEDES